MIITTMRGACFAKIAEITVKYVEANYLEVA